MVIHPSFEIKESPIHGIGLFARRNIKFGEVFECPVLVIQNPPKDIIEYTFPWNGGKGLSSICIGFPTFINHAKNPNFKIVKIDVDRKVKIFQSTRTILKGEEVTLFYSKSFQKSLDEFVW